MTHDTDAWVEKNMSFRLVFPLNQTDLFQTHMKHSPKSNMRYHDQYLSILSIVSPGFSVPSRDHRKTGKQRDREVPTEKPTSPTSPMDEHPLTEVHQSSPRVKLYILKYTKMVIHDLDDSGAPIF